MRDKIISMVASSLKLQRLITVYCLIVSKQPFSLSNVQPRILVVLPTRGERLETLEETLIAIDAQRTDVTLRVVVVAPSEATQACELARRHGATVVNDPGSGISDAINCGIKARIGEEFYAWMGDDDLFRPGGLALLQKLLDNNRSAVVAFGACDYIDEKGALLGTNRVGRLAMFFLPWGPDLIPHPGSMIRMTALDSIGLYDPSLKFAMDLDAFLKLRRKGKFVCSRQTVSAFRWHPASLTVANRRDSSREAELVKSRHLPAALRPVRFIWQFPVRWASAFAAQRVSARARHSLR